MGLTVDSPPNSWPGWRWIAVVALLLAGGLTGTVATGVTERLLQQRDESRLDQKIEATRGEVRDHGHPGISAEIKALGSAIEGLSKQRDEDQEELKERLRSIDEKAADTLEMVFQLYRANGGGG